MIRERPKQFRFTKKELDALPPQTPEAAAREAEYSDSECIGLKVLVNRQGRKYFYYRYSFNRRRQAIKIGEFPSTSLAEARQRCNELKAGVDRGMNPQAEKQQLRAIPTFRAFALEQYLPYAEQTKRSHQDDRSRLEHHLIPRFGSLGLHEVSTRAIQLFLAEAKSKGLAPATVNRLRSLLQRMLNLAVQWGLLEKNPVQGIPKFQENNFRQRFLTASEIQALLAALAVEPNHQAADVILLLLLTGARVGELLNAQRENVDLEAGFWRIPHSKSGKSRIVVLNEAAKSLFARRMEMAGSLYIFPGSPKYGNARMAPPQKAFDRVKLRAGLQDFRLHDLRHTFASLAVGAGASLYDVQKILGHSSPNMTQRYSHLADDRLKRVSDHVGEAVFSIPPAPRD